MSAQPNVLKGIPFCAEEACECRALGFNPNGICEPAVEEMAADMRRLKRELATAKKAARS